MKSFSDFFLVVRPRIIPALIIGVVFLISVIWSKFLYCLIMGLCTVLMFREWARMTGSNHRFLCLGVLIILVTVGALLLLRWIAPLFLLPYFITIWAVDIVAMLAGKAIRGPKLSPKISPNKTWSGFIVGVLSAAGVAKTLNYLDLLSDHILPFHSSFFSGLMLASIAQASDLFISLFKRKFKIKDFSNIIPGHGGIMDRFDSFVLTAPLTLLWYICSS